MVVNVHERRIAADVESVGALLAGLGTPNDRLWPRLWPPMRFDGPPAPGAHGGHGPIRYVVESLQPGRRVLFRFTGPAGFDGTHGFAVHVDGNGVTRLEHRLEMRVFGRARLTWPLLWRPLHDALLEDCLDRAAEELTASAPIGRWSPYVTLLRRLSRPV